ncbi:MAG: hypothetical protein KFW07_02400 [Mycoplasmataceae bacterium]|nr:hypothetical protein [Mycoplasmataceae bacterium]
MNYTNLEKNIFKTWAILVILVSVVFAIYSVITYTYLLGFLIGSGISIVLFFINSVFFSKLLCTKRTFRKTFIISMLKFISISILLGGFLILILYLNSFFVDNHNNGNFSIDGIINFFTLFGGLFTFPFSIVLYHISIYIMNKIKTRKVKDGSIS